MRGSFAIVRALRLCVLPFVVQHVAQGYSGEDLQIPLITNIGITECGLEIFLGQS